MDQLWPVLSKLFLQNSQGRRENQVGLPRDLKLQNSTLGQDFHFPYTPRKDPDPGFAAEEKHPVYQWLLHVPG